MVHLATVVCNNCLALSVIFQYVFCLRQRTVILLHNGARQTTNGAAKYPQEGQGEGKGDPRPHAVRRSRAITTRPLILCISRYRLRLTSRVLSTGATRSDRGLDNAGKTTILKQFMGQDITEISPTLGFDIQTLEYKR